MTTRKEIYDRLYGNRNIFQWQSVPDPQGWNSDAVAIKDTLLELKPDACLEIGVWKGMSMIYAAKHLKPSSFILGVDTFLGSQEHWRKPKAMERYENGCPKVFETMIANVLKEDVQEKVIPWSVDSRSAIELAYILKWRFQWAHIDGGHSFHSTYQDLCGVQSLMDKGYILVDDYWHENIVGATEKFCSEFECNVEKIGPKGVIHWHGNGKQLQGLWGQS
jgi:hypothetical protein